MSYVSFIPASAVADGASQSRGMPRRVRKQVTRSDGSVTVAGWLQIGLLVMTLSSVSFVLSIVVAGAF